MRKSIDTKEIGYSEYSDAHSGVHSIKHSIRTYGLEKKESLKKKLPKKFIAFLHTGLYKIEI